MLGFGVPRVWEGRDKVTAKAKPENASLPILLHTFVENGFEKKFFTFSYS